MFYKKEKIVRCYQWGQDCPTNIRRKDVLGAVKEEGKTRIICGRPGQPEKMFVLTVRDSVEEIQAQL